MHRGHEIARAEFNRHRAAAGAPPSTRTLTELISTRLAVTAARPGEHLGNAAALARDVVASLPLDEQATIALADGAHRGHLDALERKITIHLDHVADDAERKRLQTAIADLRRAIAAAHSRAAS